MTEQEKRLINFFEEFFPEEAAALSKELDEFFKRIESKDPVKSMSQNGIRK